MQFKGNESSYGFPSSALSSASKDIVQLRHQNSGPSSTGRDGYTYEYGAINSSIHDSLGGNRPGTLAARMLLRRTITDPQQRLAKIGVHKPKYSHGTLNGSGTEPEEHDRQLGFSLDGYDSLYRNQREPSSAFNVTSKTLDNLERLTKEIDRERLEDSVAATAQELEGLKNAYRLADISSPMLLMHWRVKHSLAVSSLPFIKRRSTSCESGVSLRSFTLFKV